MSYVFNFNRGYSFATACLITSIAINAFFQKPVLASTYSVGPLVTIVPLERSQARATLNVINAGDEPIRLRIYVEDFTYERAEGFAPAPSHPFSAVQYLQFSPRELVVPPKVARNVRVNILIPSSAPDGEYRAVVFAEELTGNDTPQAKTDSSLAVKFRVGSVFFVTKGSGKSDLSATDVVWNQQKNQPQLVLNNKGLSSINPEVQWKIERDGKEVDSGSIAGVIVQNGSERLATLETTKGKLTTGEYTVSGQIQSKKATPIPFSFKLKVP
jgi:hypothetical protein